MNRSTLRLRLATSPGRRQPQADAAMRIRGVERAQRVLVERADRRLDGEIVAPAIAAEGERARCGLVADRDRVAVQPGGRSGTKIDAAAVRTHCRGTPRRRRTRRPRCIRISLACAWVTNPSASEIEITDAIRLNFHDYRRGRFDCYADRRGRWPCPIGLIPRPLPSPASAGWAANSAISFKVLAGVGQVNRLSARRGAFSVTNVATASYSVETEHGQAADSRRQRLRAVGGDGHDVRIPRDAAAACRRSRATPRASGSART